jgi:hypothetical protein
MRFNFYYIIKRRRRASFHFRHALSALPELNVFNIFEQGCGSGSVSRLDLDSMTLWIRILIENPDPGSGSRGKKNKYVFS